MTEDSGLRLRGIHYRRGIFFFSNRSFLFETDLLILAAFSLAVFFAASSPLTIRDFTFLASSLSQALSNRVFFSVEEVDASDKILQNFYWF